ncbi:serine/threonine-protein kinase pim-3-like [Triplophysa rosa]|uniref:serine/threonine-protein kinase pim-3-like n=1 Tax=Triplophysa rosa TaxID=992332 RepID=UPI0025462123|nr:serine/threonine-protein kinase pim-3-like [Triplophysa rosa]
MGTKNRYFFGPPDYPEPLPREVALHKLACEGKFAPEIVRLLDWQLFPDHYVMVLEYPSPCMDLLDFTSSKGGKLKEDLAKDIMWQATMAAYMCCQRGVFHHNIKMENLLITNDTLFVKLINFGCSDLLKTSIYKTFMGTRDYACPEFFKTGEYHGKPATVYSLGAVLFAMLCGKFPNCNDRYSINERIWYKDGLSEECCDLIETCLQEDPEKRIDLEEILNHKWFQDKYPANSLQTPVHSESINVIQDPEDSGSDFNVDGEDDQEPKVRIEEINGRQYKIGRKLGQGDFGVVNEGTRLEDGLMVAVKVVKKTKQMIEDYIYIPGHPEPLPREVGIHMLACRGGKVPVIVQFLDWQDHSNHYIMVLERPSLCMDVLTFWRSKGRIVTEDIAQYILCQATEAAEICSRRGVVHRDIILQNLLINPNTLQVKLIDFGIGDRLKKTPYTEFYMGTITYICPEFDETGEYYAKPATVYSLGVVLFALVCGDFPRFHDKLRINEKMWHRDGLTRECCDLIQSCLQEDPKKRIRLENIRYHRWFQMGFTLSQPSPAGSSDPSRAIEARDEASAQSGSPGLNPRAQFLFVTHQRGFNGGGN